MLHPGESACGKTSHDSDDTPNPAGNAGVPRVQDYSDPVRVLSIFFRVSRCMLMDFKISCCLS